jgi:hypothetical protein
MNKYVLSNNLNDIKKDIDFYRMSLYPNKGNRRGVDEMIDNIGNKLRKMNACNISYELKKNDDIVVEFSVGNIKYKAKYNHTGTCEEIEEC